MNTKEKNNPKTEEALKLIKEKGREMLTIESEIRDIMQENGLHPMMVMQIMRMTEVELYNEKNPDKPMEVPSLEEIPQMGMPNIPNMVVNPVNDDGTLSQEAKEMLAAQGIDPDEIENNGGK